GLFDWTAGDINAAGNPASLIIDGATGTIEPADAGTVTIGSSWSFENGASATFYEGTVAFIAGIGIDIAEDCTIDLDPQRLGLTFQGDYQKYPEFYHIHNRGRCTVYGPDTTDL